MTKTYAKDEGRRVVSETHADKDHMDDGHGRLGIDVLLAVPLRNRRRLLLGNGALGEVRVQMLQAGKQLGMSLLVLALQTALQN
jgi:hypothetical protein